MFSDAFFVAITVASYKFMQMKIFAKQVSVYKFRLNPLSNERV